MSSFHKATREALYARLFVMGAAGDGKTYSAQRVAAGLANGGPVFVLDTHSGQAEMYAGQDDGAEGVLDFMAAQIEAPYTIPKCTDLVREAINAGAAVIIIDSLSDFWEGKGGILEAKVAKERSNSRANGYTLWLEFGRQWQQFLRLLNDVPAHVIVTSRRKTDYEIVKNDRGKSVPVAVGTKPLVREGTEYEFDFILSMQKGEARIEKTRSEAIAPIGTLLDRPGARFGKALLNWLRSGDKAEGAIRDGLLSQAREAMGAIAAQAETTVEVIENWITTEFAPLNKLPIARLRGLPGWLETPAAQHAYRVWVEKRATISKPPQAESSPPRREHPSTGAGGDEEAQRQADLDAEFASFMGWATESGIAAAYLIAGQILDRPDGMAFMRAWNSPRKWRAEAQRLEAIFNDHNVPLGDAQLLSQHARYLLNEAGAAPGSVVALQGAIRDAAEQVRAAERMISTDPADRAAAACIIAERCIRKPETFKALGLSREEG